MNGEESSDLDKSCQENVIKNWDPDRYLINWVPFDLYEPDSCLPYKIELFFIMVPTKIGMCVVWQDRNCVLAFLYCWNSDEE